MFEVNLSLWLILQTGSWHTVQLLLHAIFNTSEVWRFAWKAYNLYLEHQSWLTWTHTIRNSIIDCSLQSLLVCARSFHLLPLVLTLWNMWLNMWFDLVWRKGQKLFGGIWGTCLEWKETEDISWCQELVSLPPECWLPMYKSSEVKCQWSKSMKKNIYFSFCTVFCLYLSLVNSIFKQKTA